MTLYLPFEALPSTDYSFNLPRSQTKLDTQGGISRYSLNYDKGSQKHTINLEVSLDKLKLWMEFYRFTIKKGALSFIMNLDTGTGVTAHEVTLCAETMKIDRYSFHAKITFEAYVKSKIWDKTDEEVNTLLSEWEASSHDVNTSSFCFSGRYPYGTANTTLQRLDCRYWSVDFRIGSVATITASSAHDLEVNCDLRSNRDLVGVIWNSVDKYGHPLFRYETDRDFTGMVWGFVANPIDKYNFNMTLTTYDGTPYVYRVFPYKVSGSNLVVDVTDEATQGAGPGLTFVTTSVFPSGVTVPTGYSIFVVDFSHLKLLYDYSGASIPVTQIDNIFLSLVSPGYGIGATATLQSVTATDVTAWQINGVSPNLRLTAGDVITISYAVGSVYHVEDITVTTWTGDGTTSRYIATPSTIVGATWTGLGCIAKTLQADSPLGNEHIVFNIKNSYTTGASATIGKYYYPQPAHSLQMTTGFDDTYSITPYRQVDQIYGLGYRGRVVMYMGASHYYKATSYLDTGVYYNRLDKTATSPLNESTVAFCANLFSLLHDLGYQFVWSTSLEILLSQIPPEWAQKDADSNLAQSGYTPPTSFLIPTSNETGTYIANVIKQGLGLMVAAGLDPNYQMGEFWWWDGSYTNNKPCIYDYTTLVLYNTETGLYAPTTITDIFALTLTADERAYCVWLGEKLGQFTHYVRDAVHTAIPTAQSSMLFFSPQIFSEASIITPLLNFPESYWKYPNMDFMQIEDYDWVLAGKFDKLPLTITAATDRLGYPKNKVDYFIGFVNRQRDNQVWDFMSVAGQQAKLAGLTNLFVWAYPQIIRDGIIDGLRLPAGMMPVLDNGYTISSLDGVVQSNPNSPNVSSALKWRRGIRKINTSLTLTQGELEVFLTWLYRKAQFGTLSFQCPLDDGYGVLSAKVNIVPESLTVKYVAYNLWSVAMSLEGEIPDSTSVLVV